MSVKLSGVRWKDNNVNDSYNSHKNNIFSIKIKIQVTLTGKERI